jgi:hypothetical protein
MRATLERVSIMDEISSAHIPTMRGHSSSKLRELANDTGYSVHVDRFEVEEIGYFTMTFYRKTKIDWLYSAWDSTLDFFTGWW